MRCMESMRSIAWNQHKVLHGIKPTGYTLKSVMPYAAEAAIPYNVLWAR